MERDWQPNTTKAFRDFAFQREASLFGYSEVLMSSTGSRVVEEIAGHHWGRKTQEVLFSVLCSCLVAVPCLVYYV